MSAPDVPPQQLTTDLEVDPSTWAPADIYGLLTSLVVPRPVAWVSTLAPDGTRNLAPHSFFTVLAESPPHVGVVSIGRKDTLRNAEATGELVISITSMDQLEQLNATSAKLPPDGDEFSWAGVAAIPSTVVGPPRPAGAAADLECRLVAVHTHGDGHLLVGEVVHVHVRHDVWRDGGVDVELLDPIMRLGGPWYAHVGDRVELARPTVEPPHPTA